MNEEARKARNAWRREWAKKNPDKVKEYNERYWSKKAAEMKAAEEAAAQASANVRGVPGTDPAAGVVYNPAAE